MSTTKLAHEIWDCKYHEVLVPKYRYKVFTREAKEFARDEIKKLCLWMQEEIIEGQVCQDHIHLCLAIPPKYSILEELIKQYIRDQDKFDRFEMQGKLFRN